ncbi:MAG: hypothetical protein IJV85_01520 [Clostridia bacterium]|nr:hypothetical protein [Clostridia bacterium]
MKKKFKIVLALGCLSLLCFGAGCAKNTMIDDYKQKGYTISVTYNPNGGSFIGSEGVTIVDMYNPSNFEKDGEGAVHIKLLEPTDPQRPNSATGPITLTLSDHFFAGWYQTREVVTVDGVPVDKNGRELKQKEDGTYVYATLSSDEEETTVMPAYTYSDYWDFETDTIDYTEGDPEVNITLYAGWVEYYEFNYYYQKDGNWTKLDETTSFDYKMKLQNPETYAKDTIWVPTWQDGAMQYTYKYSVSEEYSFPKLSGMTFSKAYTDEALTNEITHSFEHIGTLDPDYGDKGELKVENRVQNIYVTYEEGERYKISTAQQLAANVNLKGYYEIQADLDFTDIAWPTAFAYGEFEGKMYSTEGNTYTIKNVSVTYASESKYGGVFGAIANGAVLKDIKFENVAFDLAYTGYSRSDRQFGMFAGWIDNEASVSGVTVGGVFKIGKITTRGECDFHLIANGNTAGITKTDVALQFYGEKLGEQYLYTIDPQAVTIGGDGTVSITVLQSEIKLVQEIYNIE